MKRFFTILAFVFVSTCLYAQVPQAINFQAIARDGNGNPMLNATIEIRLSVVDSALGGSVVYQEERTLQTNGYGSFSFQIGVNPSAVTVGSMQVVDWVTDNKYLKIDYDPSISGNFTLTLGVIKLVSVPYAFAAEKVVYIDATGAQSGDALIYNSTTGKFQPGQINVDWSTIQNKPALAAVATSGDYNDLSNRPVVDGSEAKVQSGSNVSVTGTGTTANPYIVSSGGTKVEIGSSQTWTVPNGVSKIKVELWGGAGGGGGIGMYSYSQNNGGNGGSGGYAEGEMNVSRGQQFSITVGLGGSAGSNAYSYSMGSSFGDTNGNDGGDTYFVNSSTLKAAGGQGGKSGSYSGAILNGVAGSANVGTITGYASNASGNVLDVFQGLSRSYIYDRVLTSKPGTGGGYSISYSLLSPMDGEGGYAIITFY